MAESVRWRADPHGGGGDARGSADHRRSGGGLGCDGGEQGYAGERRRGGEEREGWVREGWERAVC
jgi:hypothetical protein